MAGMIPTFGPPRGVYTGGLPALQGVGQGGMSPAQAGWGPQQPAPPGGYQQMGQRPQMMANALMGAPPGSIPQQLGNTGNWGYATPEQQAANRAPPPPGYQPMQSQFGVAQPMPNMGQAAATQAMPQAAPQQPTMARPASPSRMYRS
jgi:hypothetical protein